jgi:hypothetical protein
MAVESEAPEIEAPGKPGARRGGVGLWFVTLFRSLFNILVTLAVLAAVGLVADVVLHRVTHVSRTSSSYTGIYEIDVVLDGDGSVSVTGSPGGAHTVTLAETDTATIFDHPQRTADVIAGALFVTAHCSDPLCDANLTLTAPPDVTVKVRIGNAFHVDRAALALSGLTGQVDLVAWPARVTIVNSTATVTGQASGPISCGSTAFCQVRIPR